MSVHDHMTNDSSNDSVPTADCVETGEHNPEVRRHFMWSEPGAQIDGDSAAIPRPVHSAPPGTFGSGSASSHPTPLPPSASRDSTRGSARPEMSPTCCPVGQHGP